MEFNSDFTTKFKDMQEIQKLIQLYFCEGFLRYCWEHANSKYDLDIIIIIYYTLIGADPGHPTSSFEALKLTLALCYLFSQNKFALLYFK